MSSHAIPTETSSFYIHTKMMPQCVRFCVPGGFSYNWKPFEFKVYQDMVSFSDSSVVSPALKTAFLKRFAKTSRARKTWGKEEIKNMLKGIPPAGFEVAHKIPLFCGGLDRETNIMLVEKTAAARLNQYLWQPMARKIQKTHADPITVEIPWMPPLLTQEMVDTWWEQNQERFRQNRYLMKQSMPEKTPIYRKCIGNRIILTPGDNPFSQYPTRLVEVLPPEPNAKQLFRSDKLLRQAVVQQVVESYWLPQLNTRQMRAARARGTLPEKSGLNIHHILPLLLGGQNTLDNLVLLDSSTHYRVHRYVLNDLATIVLKEQNRQANAPEEKRKRIFVRLPILPPSGRKLSHCQQQVFTIDALPPEIHKPFKTPAEKEAHLTDKKSRGLRLSLDIEEVAALPSFERIVCRHRIQKRRLRPTIDRIRS